MHEKIEEVEKTHGMRAKMKTRKSNGEGILSLGVWNGVGSRGDSLRLEEKHEESHQGCVHRGEVRRTENDRETENGERKMSLGQP